MVAVSCAPAVAVGLIVPVDVGTVGEDFLHPNMVEINAKIIKINNGIKIFFI